MNILNTDKILCDNFKNSAGIEFILVRPGEFDMGSPILEKRRKLWESPVHRVKIERPFYLGKYSVTQAQWQEVMGDSPSYFKGGRLPVESVSWECLQDFLKKLNEKENTNLYRLPTEAEWEYAARADTVTGYFFGENAPELSDYAWFLKNSGLKTHPVGLKKPNPWGFYDIYGNVGEWVQDEFHINYTGAPSDGKAWQSPLSAAVSKPFRVRRGGGWNGNAGCCRSAERLFAEQNRRFNSLGFRVAKALYACQKNGEIVENSE